MPISGPPATLSGTAASGADALAGTDTSKYVTCAALRYAVDAITNPRSTQGALAFDGTAANAAAAADNAALAGGTDDFSHVIKTKRATWTPAAEVSLVEKAASNLGWRFRLTTGGYLKLQIGNGSNYTTYAYTSTAAVDLAAYQTASLAFSADRDGNVTFYVNGKILGSAVAISGSAAQTITSTGTLRIGYDGTTSDTCIVFCHQPYNVAIDQATISEIQELGGGVPERYKNATQIALYTSDYSAGANGWSADAPVNNTGNTDSINSQNDWLAAERTTSTGHLYSRRDFGAATSGKALRLRARVFIPAGSPITHIQFFANNANTLGVVRAVAANTQYDLDEVVVTAKSVSNLIGIRACDSGGSIASVVAGTIFYQKTVIANFVGAVADYAADLGGAGYQLHDAGTNKLHQLITSTGASWTKPATMGYVRALSDGTTVAQQLGGGTILPANCQIIRVRARSTSGTPSITLGTSSGGSQIVASVALSTAWKDLTIALTGGINSANNSLWMTASAANVVEVQLAYEQLPA